MNKEFRTRILTAGTELLDTQVTEVIIPSFDGEAGVLANHENFIGLLGTGVMKIVAAGDDYWFMVSSGVYEMMNGELTILTEVAESAKDIDIDHAKQRLASVEPKLIEVNSYEDESQKVLIEFDRARARIEAYRRTHLVN